jgi:hypothetical protein
MGLEYEHVVTGGRHERVDRDAVDKPGRADRGWLPEGGEGI